MRDPTTARITNFLIEIGLPVRFDRLPGATVLPGVSVDSGVLIVDEAKLTYSGDLLHEAGHLAILPADVRAHAGPNLSGDAGEEMAAIAWSYAAAVHLDVDPKIVFHAGGYRGGSDCLIENFTDGHYVGVPLLQWFGMTAESRRAWVLGVPPYPNMLRWLRP